MTSAVADGSDQPSLRGNLERVDRRRIVGWVWDPLTPTKPVRIAILDGDDVIATLVADVFRPDLAAAGFGDGRRGFDIALAQGLSPFRDIELRVRHARDGRDIPGSPARLPRVTDDDPLTRIRITEALAHAVRHGSPFSDLSSIRHALEIRAIELGAPDASLVPRPRALVIENGDFPAAGRDGGSTAVLSHTLMLHRLGFSVTVAATDGRSGPHTDLLAAAGITCALPPVAADVESALSDGGAGWSVVYLHRLATMRRFGRQVRRVSPGARLIYSLADLHHLRIAREAELTDRDDLRERASAVRVEELAAVAMADAVITHSMTEAEWLVREGATPVFHVPWTVRSEPVTIPFADRAGVGFLASYGHAPNRDAAAWLLDEIMPRVWVDAPEIACRLAGSDIPGSIRTLNRAGPRGVDVLGRIDRPSDLFARVRLTVAPLRFGAGAKAKVVESLASGVPCVCTSIAAEGLDLPSVVPVADDPVEFARTIVVLHRDAARCAEITTAGVTWALQRWSDAAVSDALSRAVGLRGVSDEPA